MKTILIVDDQPGIRLLLEEVFTNEGYQTATARNGMEAFEKVRECEPDLILLDMKIPGMDGIEILKKLKADCSRIKVIMMTAYGEKNLIEETISHGAVRYFTKPFDIFEVLRIVKQLLQD
ncbi:response regulator [Planococcus salinus]|uniref:Response regulator n=1 Tax=Planococcus salinus TaxID=1848460 RepID=A0A3M8PA14_9BACL|nr:response regulator [Planococcus salinus]RNF40034.1 response regulator [Planococcus salinus]